MLRNAVLINHLLDSGGKKGKNSIQFKKYQLTAKKRKIAPTQQYQEITLPLPQVFKERPRTVSLSLEVAMTTGAATRETDPLEHAAASCFRAHDYLAGILVQIWAVYSSGAAESLQRLL